MKLEISSDFFPPDLSDAGRKKTIAQFFGEHGAEGDNWFRKSGKTTPFGKVGMVVCWYFDGFDDSELLRDAPRLVKLIPTLLAGEYERLTDGDLFEFWDAPGSFPLRDELLDRVYNVLDREQRLRTRKGRSTKRR